MNRQAKTFTFKGVEYIGVEQPDQTCDGCAFYDGKIPGACVADDRPNCSASNRHDGESLIWIKKPESISRVDPVPESFKNYQKAFDLAQSVGKFDDFCAVINDACLMFINDHRNVGKVSIAVDGVTVWEGHTSIATPTYIHGDDKFGNPVGVILKGDI